ncbi:Uncharacterized conserved protein YkwD, contains CAP (CSP/antigen 5/PR1) domain [Nocardioides terrae]|uniref:Uncharacterized conserved protein YkwD, contains CAP (CSP/antigen 5/PR1) domain n=1 Tax=Nocardioides terrae TaxID=574651 RepID=A0A1I1MK40_9ACTN|nr:CAP domain-containing protein [Nocardioides terrae]SFC83528.1 Uncharacterized conserved protein YkwD, contains CAP (CSP/antigen 5/PR1) domain [Nocardioides terrae]
MTTLTRTFVSILIAVFLAATTVTLLGPPADATTASAYGRAAERATNAVRRAHDLHRLRSDACLQRHAVAQARRMAAQRRMFHQDIGATLRACGLTSVGENVAVGYRTGRGVVRHGWMHSPPHRANILHRQYRLIAVAARKGADGRWYASQVFGRR